MSFFFKPIRLAISLYPFFATMLAISCKDPDSSYTSNSKTQELVKQYYRGQNIFKQYCMNCHAIPNKMSTDQFVFNNLFSRLPQPSEEYFAKYIGDSKQLRISGDKHALEVAKVWNSVYEHNFKDVLSQKDIEDLIVYIKVAERKDK